MDKQLEYMRTQFNASLGWRLIHHETQLKDIHSVLTQVSDVMVHLQEELSQCKNMLHTLSEEISFKATTTFGHASVQTHSVEDLKKLTSDYTPLCRLACLMSIFHHLEIP